MEFNKVRLKFGNGEVEVDGSPAKELEEEGEEEDEDDLEESSHYRVDGFASVVMI